MKLLQHFKLSLIQWVGLVLLSLNFWYSGLVIVRSITQYLGWSYFVLVTLCALGIPIAFFSIRGVRLMMQLTKEQTHTTVSIITGIVGALHVLSLYYAGAWYAASGRELVLVCAWLGVFSVTVLLVSYWSTGLARTNRK